MDGLAAYDDDIYAWSLQEGAALRRLAETHRDLPNELDLRNVAEEIDDVGSSHLHRVESFLELLLRHLLKIASAPNAPANRHWRGEIAIHHRAFRKEFRNSMRQNIGIGDEWLTKKVKADAELDAYDDVILPDLPELCPFDLDDVTVPSINIDEAVARLGSITSAAAVS